ncbi:MAG: C13 family peptidase [Caulobacteraceae bacterium]
MSRLLGGLTALVAALVCLGGPAHEARASGPLSDWAGVIVAGDFHAHSGAPSEAFDNARRDVTHALIAAGFSPENLRQFSVRPQNYPAERLMQSEPGLIASQLGQLASTARGGCLVYFTSHGSPAGVVIGDRLLSPAGLSEIVDEACGERPTVVIVSACFSGVFVPPLSRPDRMVLTAARPDRSSFGCGEADRYPYFDACMLETLPRASNFAVLGKQVQDCVAAKEKATGMAPPSEPQLFLGSQLRPMVPFFPLKLAQSP